MLKAYSRIPLVGRIIAAMFIGILLGFLLGPAVFGNPISADWRTVVLANLKLTADVVLKLLRLLATPLIFLAVLHALMTKEMQGRQAARLLGILMTNSAIAVLIGLGVANILQPGTHIQLGDPGVASDRRPYSISEDLIGKLPSSVGAPFDTNDIIGLIALAIGFGLALRQVRTSHPEGFAILDKAFDALYGAVMVLLKWVLELVPLAVIAVVARLVAEKGIGELLRMLWFVLAVVLALALMVVVYLVRLRLQTKIPLGKFFRGASEALLLAFSTASSAATLPVTYRCATQKIGVSEESASMGIMVGGTFNHDGTALYEAMAALFISQALGRTLGLGEQAIIVLMAIVASVGAAGIPEAGLVTMLAVFTAVGLPVEYIPLLLPLDWFLDRCRTTINVLGDLVSTCVVDRDRTTPGSTPQPA